MENIEKCPYCGNTKFVEGVHCGYATIKPVDKIFTMKETNLYHIICLNCGAVIKSYVKKPEKLVTKKRKSQTNNL